MSTQIELGSVQETLLLPLWGRAVESKKDRPLLDDKKAVSIIENIKYDFTKISSKVSKLSMASWIARSIFFDDAIKSFIKDFPKATVVNIGCGLDTTFDRIDNGKIQWIDLDLPDVIKLRRQYIAESERRQFIDKSVFDPSWMVGINDLNGILLLFAGVLYYFEENKIKELFSSIGKAFSPVDILFDYSSKRGIEVANKQVIKKGGMDEVANLRWGLDSLKELETWGMKISILEDMPMFKDHQKRYPWKKRIGMKISDGLKIMSLAHIRIG